MEFAEVAWAQSALIAVPLFAGTNADDLVLLTIFFANPRTRPGPVIAGQLIGIGFIVAASVLAARFAVQLPASWIPLLGFVPVVIGVRHFFSTPPETGKPRAAPGWATVAAITIANGGDNLGVYIPVFTIEPAVGTAVICLVFGLLTMAWCAFALWIVRHPTLGLRLENIMLRSAPFVLIAVGLWILAKHPFAQAEWTR